MGRLLNGTRRVAMDASDSFSYAWLIDVVGRSRRSHDDGAGSFIEIDPDGFFSMRWHSTSDDGFDFSLPPLPQRSDLIFPGVTPSARRLSKSPSVNSNRFDSPPRLCAGSSTPGPAKKMTRKYGCFLTPLYKMAKDLSLVASSSSSSFKSASTGKDSARSSPRSSDAMSNADINADISIDDAILHCKKSIGRGM